MDYQERIQRAKRLSAENAEKNRAAMEQRNKEVKERQEKEKQERIKPYIEKLICDLEDRAREGCRFVRIESLPFSDVEYTNNNGNVQIRSFTLTAQLMNEIRRLGLKVTPQCYRRVDLRTPDCDTNTKFWLEVTYDEP